MIAPRCDGVLFWTIVGCTLLGTLAFLLVILSPAHAHDAAAMTDPQRGAWFESLKQPGSNTSCCNLEDCHQTQARQRDDGSWEAIVPRYDRTEWERIPPEKVVKRPLSIDGEAYVCNSLGSPGGEPEMGYGGQTYKSAAYDGPIYCFVPPIPGF